MISHHMVSQAVYHGVLFMISAPGIIRKRYEQSASLIISKPYDIDIAKNT